MRAIRKLLVANRGEIAVRIIKACREMKITSVAIFSDADKSSLHTREADEAYHIGPSPATESYLNIDKILEAAEICGVDAVHPGYGFLSENATFANGCESKDIIFVGPGSQTLRKTENKLALKKVAEANGIPTLPSEEGVEDPATYTPSIEFPVMLKSAFGGAGKGIRIVKAKSELEAAIKYARLEGRLSYGRSEIYVEKLLEHPRHIEIQILGDSSGKIIHLGERECSIQRRFQKLIEESPSPAVTPELRKQITNAAIKIMSAVGYVNAGTVEFLIDDNSRFYFNEINSRLQVEHPVTEMVTGVDIVNQQLKIASGELSLNQDDIALNGWAIECRINAEDPFRNFLPSPGTVTKLQLPKGPNVRVDTCLFENASVPLYYDSLLAKVIAWGGDRTAAIERLRVALSALHVEGVKTTIALHKAILMDESFVRGALSTSFLEHRRILENLKALQASQTNGALRPENN